MTFKYLRTQQKIKNQMTDYKKLIIPAIRVLRNTIGKLTQCEICVTTLDNEIQIGN